MWSRDILQNRKVKLPSSFLFKANTHSRLGSDLGNLFPFVEIGNTCCWSCNSDLPNEKRPPSGRTHITGLDHMSFVTQVIKNWKWKKKDNCTVECVLFIILIRYIVKKQSRWKWIYHGISTEPTHLSKELEKVCLRSCSCRMYFWYAGYFALLFYLGQKKRSFLSH